MEQLSRTPEQQAKWERAEEIRRQIREGIITNLSELDPRETSIEFVHEAKNLLHSLGAQAIK